MRKAIFRSGICYLADLDGHPFSIRKLRELAASGQLETVKLGRARCVTQDAWNNFIKGYSAVAQKSNEAA